MATPLWEQAGIPKELFDRLPPSDKLTLARTHNPQPPVVRRPVQGYKPSPAQQAELDAITNRDAKVARYREMALEAAQPREGGRN